MATRVYHTVVIRVSRRTNDVDGNPRFRLHTEAGEVLMVEGQAAYSVDETWDEQPVRLTLAEGNRITAIEKLELRDTRPRLPRDRKRSQTFATGAVATDNHGSYVVTVPSSDGTPGSSHPSRVRSRALVFARSIWGGSAVIGDRLSPALVTAPDGSHVPSYRYAVIVVDPIDAYAFAAGNGLYGGVL